MPYMLCDECGYEWHGDDYQCPECDSEDVEEIE